MPPTPCLPVPACTPAAGMAWRPFAAFAAAFPNAGTRRAARMVAGVLAALLLGAVGAVQAADVTARGAELYTLHCAACHGEGGRPVLAGTPDFTRPDALMRPDGLLIRVIREGRGAMPAYYGVLSDAEMRQLVAHLRRLR